jgi:hypothetical protein
MVQPWYRPIGLHGRQDMVKQLEGRWIFITEPLDTENTRQLRWGNRLVYIYNMYIQIYIMYICNDIYIYVFVLAISFYVWSVSRIAIA